MAANMSFLQRHNTMVISRAEPGDLIEFPRGIYSHWAVYIGNGEVVHLTGVIGRNSSQINPSGQRFDKAQVKVEKFWDVVEGSRAMINNTKDEKYKPLSKRMIVQNAMSRVGHVEYNVLLENCEHFASWCRYGQGKSDQADTFMESLRTATGGLAVVGALLCGVMMLRGAKEKPQ